MDNKQSTNAIVMDTAELTMWKVEDHRTAPILIYLIDEQQHVASCMQIHAGNTSEPMRVFYALKWALSMATVDAATSDGSPQNVGVVYLVHFSAQV